MLQYNRIRYLIRRGSEEYCGPTLNIVSNTTSLMWKQKTKNTPTITTHMNPVCEAWTQGIECLLVALVLTQFSLRMKTVTHDWTHTMILTDRACDLISVSSSHLSISAVFICSVPSWELAASAQQLQGAWRRTKTGCQKTLTQKEKKKLRLSAWKWRLLSEH